MARFRRSFRGRGRSPARRLKWCSPGNSPFSLAVNQDSLTGVVVCSAAELAAFTDPTIVRVKGDLILSLSNSNSTVAQATDYTLALLVCDGNLGTYDPTTSAAADSPWMWLKHGRLVVNQMPVWNGAAIEFRGYGGGAWTMDQIHVDVKAMRRCLGNASLQLWLKLTNGVNVANGALVMRGLLRALVKE